MPTYMYTLGLYSFISSKKANKREKHGKPFCSRGYYTSWQWQGYGKHHFISTTVPVNKNMWLQWRLSKAGVLKLFLRRAGWDSSATWKGQNYFWRGGGGGGGKACAKRTSRAWSAKSLAAMVQGPLKGPGSSGVIDALWCNLSLILDHLQFVWNLFYYTECNQIEACFILSHKWLKREINSRVSRAGLTSLAGRSLRTADLKGNLDCFHTRAKCVIWIIIWIAHFELRSVHTREVIAIFELRSVRARETEFGI